MCSFHNFFIDAIRYALDLSMEQSEQHGDLSEISDAELLGLPQADPKAWSKQEGRRALKVLRWIESVGTLHFILLWLHVAQPVMHLHATLFKYAQDNPSCEAKKSYLFSMCNFSKSAAYRALLELTRTLTSRTPWSILEGILGFPVEQWPHEFKHAARISVLNLLGQVWRRLVNCYTTWPWLMVRIADPDVPEEQKRSLARGLFSVPEENLDAGFSLKVRRQARTIDALLSEEWQQFLFHVVNQCIISTAFVECLFAHFKQWLQRSPKPLSSPLLQAKHMTSSFKRACKVKRGLQQEKKLRTPTKKRRPEWAIRRGESGQKNARHVWIGEQVRQREVGVSSQEAFRVACNGWPTASVEDKARCKKTAQNKNRVSSLMKTASVEMINLPTLDLASPWDVAEGHDLPLPPGDVSRIMDIKNGVTHYAGVWKEGGQRIQPDPDFPAEVRYFKPLKDR